MQMIQFITMMSQATFLLATKAESSPPRVTIVYLVYILSLFFLFAQFYVQSYIKPKKSKKA